MPVSGIYFRCKILIIAISTALCVFAAVDLRAQSGTEAIITNNFANIRSGPGTGFTRVGRAYEGDRLPVTDIRSEWIGVTFQGRPAWVFASLVRLEASGPSQQEIDRVDIRVEDLNNRLDRLMSKLETATAIVEQRYPEPPAPDTMMAAMARPKRIMQPAERVSPAWVFIPGGPRLAAGDRLRGWGLLGLTAACAGGGYYFHDRYRDYQSDYRMLPAGAPAAEFEKLFNKADDSRRVSDVMLYATAGLYAVNVLDYFFFLPRAMAGMAVDAAPTGGGRIKLSLSREF